MNAKNYKNLVAGLGCAICGGPAQLHHPRFAAGMGQRASDWLVIPLCSQHHLRRHNEPALFKISHGDETNLLAQTIERVMRKVA